MSKKTIYQPENQLVPAELTGLPALFDAPDIDVGERLYERTPYVNFVSNKSPNFGKLSVLIPDLNDGDPVFVSPKATAKLSPFTFFLLRAFQHFSVRDTQGNIVKSLHGQDAVERAKSMSDRKDPMNRYDENIETVLLVPFGGSIIPCRCNFKGTKVNAAHKAIDTLRLIASTPEKFNAMGADYAASAAVPQAWARFKTLVKLRPGTSRANGFPYVAAEGVLQPAGVGDWQQLSSLMSDQKYRSMSDDVLAQHNETVESVKAKGV